MSRASTPSRSSAGPHKSKAIKTRTTTRTTPAQTTGELEGPLPSSLELADTQAASKGVEITILGVPRELVTAENGLTLRETGEACLKIIRDICNEVERETAEDPESAITVICEIDRIDTANNNSVYVRPNPSCALAKELGEIPPALLNPYMERLEEEENLIVSWSQADRGKDKRVKLNVVNTVDGKYKPFASRETERQVFEHVVDKAKWEGVLSFYRSPIGITVIVDHPDRIPTNLAFPFPPFPSLAITASASKAQRTIESPGQLTMLCTDEPKSFFLSTITRKINSGVFEASKRRVRANIWVQPGYEREIQVTGETWDEMTLIREYCRSKDFQDYILPSRVTGPFLTFDINTTGVVKSESQRIKEAGEDAKQAYEATQEQIGILREENRVLSTQMTQFGVAISSLAHAQAITNYNLSQLTLTVDNHKAQAALIQERADQWQELRMLKLKLEMTPTKKTDAVKSLQLQIEESIERIEAIDCEIKEHKDSLKAVEMIAPPNLQIAEGTAPPEYSSPRRPPPALAPHSRLVELQSPSGSSAPPSPSPLSKNNATLGKRKANESELVPNDDTAGESKEPNPIRRRHSTGNEMNETQVLTPRATNPGFGQGEFPPEQEEDFNMGNNN